MAILNGFRKQRKRKYILNKFPYHYLERIRMRRKRYPIQLQRKGYRIRLQRMIYRIRMQIKSGLTLNTEDYRRLKLYRLLFSNQIGNLLILINLVSFIYKYII